MSSILQKVSSILQKLSGILQEVSSILQEGPWCCNNPPNSQTSIQFVVGLLLLRWATTEHAGEGACWWGSMLVGEHAGEGACWWGSMLVGEHAGEGACWWGSMLVGVEQSFLFVQRWKLMVVKQQLQVTNYAASLGRSQALLSAAIIVW